MHEDPLGTSFNPIIPNVDRFKGEGCMQPTVGKFYRLILIFFKYIFSPNILNIQDERLHFSITIFCLFHSYLA